MSRCGQGHFLEEVTGIGDRKPAFWGGKPTADPVPALPFLTCSLKALPLQLLGTNQAHSRLQRCPHEDKAGPHGTLRGHSEVRRASGHTTDEGSPTAIRRLPQALRLPQGPREGAGSLLSKQGPVGLRAWPRAPSTGRPSAPGQALDSPLPLTCSRWCQACEHRSSVSSVLPVPLLAAWGRPHSCSECGSLLPEHSSFWPLRQTYPSPCPALTCPPSNTRCRWPWRTLSFWSSAPLHWDLGTEPWINQVIRL